MKRRSGVSSCGSSYAGCAGSIGRPLDNPPSPAASIRSFQSLAPSSPPEVQTLCNACQPDREQSCVLLDKEDRSYKRIEYPDGTNDMKSIADVMDEGLEVHWVYESDGITTGVVQPSLE